MGGLESDDEPEQQPWMWVKSMNKIYHCLLKEQREKDEKDGGTFSYTDFDKKKLTADIIRKALGSEKLRKGLRFDLEIGQCEMKDKAPAVVFYNPSTWPTWAKWVSGISAALGSFFGYHHFFGKSKRQAEASQYPTYAKVGAGVALAGAATFGAYQMGCLGDQEEGFGSAIRDLVPGRSTPRKEKKEKPSGMSTGMIGLVMFLFLLAVIIGGAVVYFVPAPKEDAACLEEIRVEH